MAQTGNPFYIDPLGGYGGSIMEGLSGLGAVVGKRREQDRMANEARSVFESNDPNKIAEFSLQYPQYSDQVIQAVKFKNDATKENFLQSSRRILAGENPEQVITERAKMVQAQGGDPIETLGELDVWRQDPENYNKKVATAYALLDPKGYTEFKKAIAPAEGEKLTGNAANTALTMFGTADISRLSPEQRQQLSAEMQRAGGEQSFTGAYGNLALAMFGTKDPSQLQPEQMQQLDQEARRRELERPPSTSVTINPEQKTFSNEQDLRKELSADQTVKNFKEIQFAYDQISTALKKPTAANDLTAATKFMKILDPDSVVRESELGLAMAATGKLDLAMNYFNRLQTGEKLTPDQRKDFGQAAEALYKAAEGRATPVLQQYRDIAEDSGLNPNRVFDSQLLGKTKGRKPSTAQTGAKIITQSLISDLSAKSGLTSAQAVEFLKSKGYATK